MCKHELKWNSFGPRPIYCSVCPNFISSFTSDHSCFYCDYHECNTCYKIEKLSVNEKFYNASRHGKLYAVRHYLSEGANKDIIMPNGYTALMIASERGHLDIVRHLLSIKVNIDIKNKQNKCAILLATDKKILYEFL